jgi:hypothetical protein
VSGVPPPPGVAVLATAKNKKTPYVPRGRPASMPLFPRNRFGTAGLGGGKAEGTSMASIKPF